MLLIKNFDADRSIDRVACGAAKESLSSATPTTNLDLLPRPAARLLLSI
ncbi:MAG TPA: hypothetical protein VIK18_09760 [Pirellulales bacterium]